MRKTIKAPPPKSAIQRPRAFDARPEERWYELKASAREATLYIYGEIGGWFDGVLVADLVRELAEIVAPEIRVRINSPGGDVWGGIALYNALAQHPARITTQVDGVAASIASLVFMAGEDRLVSIGTRVMVHDPWTCACGNAREFREAADWLETIEEDMLDVYAEGSGVARAAMAAMMEKETWFSAEEAVAQGLATGTVADDAPPQMKARFNLSLFAHAPADLASRREDRANSRTEAPQTVREVEQILRDGGCSHAQAKAIASAGFKAKPEPRDEDGGEPEDPAAYDALLVKMFNTRKALA